MMQFRVLTLLTTAIACASFQLPAFSQSCQTVTLMPSRAPTGSSGNNLSSSPNLSADGRYTSFSSSASNLVPGDNNGLRDVFRHDRLTGETEAVSMRFSFGTPLFGNGDSTISSISHDGRYIAFESTATNLMATTPDTNNSLDIYVRDMQTGVIERASITTFGQQANGISWAPVISGDGRYIAFQTTADLLDFVSDNNGQTDIYVRDRVDGFTRMVSRNSSGELANGGSSAARISGDGRWITHRSSASNLVFNDTNEATDIFLYDSSTGLTERVSVGPDTAFGFPTQANGSSFSGSVSDDGRYVAFASDANNLSFNDNNNRRDIFVRDTLNDTTRVVSVTPGMFLFYGNGTSQQPSISGNGRYVVFGSFSNNLINGDSNGVQDIFRRDLLLNFTSQVSLASNSGQSGGSCYNPAISRDGTWIAWQSGWNDFVPLDNNGTDDVFTRGPDCTFPETYCTAKTNSLGCSPTMAWSGEAKADLSGNFVLSCSQALNQKPGLPFFGFAGRETIPFQNGILCVRPPTKRGPISTSGGSLGFPDCSGVFSIDMDAYAQGSLGGNPPSLLSEVGTLVNVQWWGRDPDFAAPNNTQLSNALEYTVRP